ncbi:hypothetical protein [Halorientalis marina]|nr:hypothetical protein [Halorientalis marina]
MTERPLRVIAVAPVTAPRVDTPGYARLSDAASKERLQEGVERLASEGYL